MDGEGNSDTDAECERAEGDVASTISESSGCFVDTDIDSEVDVEAKTAARARSRLIRTESLSTSRR